MADHQRRFARTMRREPTLAERKLWLLLRSSRLEGRKFRRQVPMGAFIADFVCHESKVVVEVDGGQHGGEADVLRDQWFHAAGYQVLRFWNNDVLRNPNGVLEAIMLAAGRNRR
ncbi:endonuclease domain-containing protein [Pseudorhodoplanes sp.]|uniref:endonuclease domain-containing protein n=1 Tax=Pseudorhodoplanes sp. TaxID=1934341 RepID=UPI002D7ECC1F|nr:endonuclease domain-containing protein [Pseudorhodoplanes sp.]